MYEICKLLIVRYIFFKNDSSMRTSINRFPESDSRTQCDKQIIFVCRTDVFTTLMV